MTRVKLINLPEARTFRAGPPMVIELDPDPEGPVFRCRRATRLDLARFWLRDRWRYATRWLRPRIVCSAIDHDAGVVTYSTERWSWRRWRWERA